MRCAFSLNDMQSPGIRSERRWETDSPSGANVPVLSFWGSALGLSTQPRHLSVKSFRDGLSFVVVVGWENS